VNRRWSTLLVWAATIGLIVGVSVQAWAGNEVNGTSLLNMVLFALPLAGIYALSASGLVVVYATTGIFNFAQGAIGLLFAYVFWQMTDPVEGWNLPTWIALPLVVFVLAPLFGAGLDRAIMRHLRGASLVTQLMVTVGIMFALIGVVGLIWDQTESHSLPPFFGNDGFEIGDVTLTWHRFITIVTAALLAIGLRILLFRTRLGIAMRAVVDNRDLASLSGARASGLSSFSWGLGCALGALAGILLAPEAGMSSGGPLPLLIISAFAAAVVGRLRSLPLTYLGALILGLAISWNNNFLTFTGAWTNMERAIPTIMLFIVLLLLPRAQLEFARLRVTRRQERVSTVRDTLIGMAVLFVVMALVSLLIDDGSANLNRLSLGMCTALVALALVPLIGWAGQVSLAPLAFAGIGATAYARLGGDHGSLLAVLLAALICMPIGALLAFPAMRLQGLYLALATLAFASMVEFVFFPQDFAIGAGGRTVTRIELFGMDFDDQRAFLLLVTAIFCAASVGVVALRRGAWGRRLIALRDSEAASATVGVNILETKLVVFAFSAGLSGFAGAFLAQHYETLSTGTTQFGMLLGLPIVLALVIGGVACVSGALFAGVFGLIALLIQENWDLSLWVTFVYLAPGLAALGIIQNPAGAVVAIGDGFAPLLPWREDARREKAELKAAQAEAEVGDLGIERPFAEDDVLLVDRALGISNDVPRAAVGSG
jgi:branched-chain amino acid transport system permease protein